MNNFILVTPQEGVDVTELCAVLRAIPGVYDVDDAPSDITLPVFNPLEARPETVNELTTISQYVQRLVREARALPDQSDTVWGSVCDTIFSDDIALRVQTLCSQLGDDVYIRHNTFLAESFEKPKDASTSAPLHTVLTYAAGLDLLVGSLWEFAPEESLDNVT